jgi:hypothetical protein
MFLSRRNKILKDKIFELEEENQELKEENEDLDKEYNILSDDYDLGWDSCDYNYELYKGLESKNTEILNEKQKIENQLCQKYKEIEDLKIENLNLKVELKLENSNWKNQADCAWWINPITGEREEHSIPFDFDEKMVRNLKFTNNGATREFRYFDKSEPDSRGDWKFFKDIPVSLYDYLCDKKSKFKYQNNQTYSKSNVKDINDLKNFLNKKGQSLTGKYVENVYKFIIEKIGKPFTTKEFIKNCQFDNRESARQYLQKLKQYSAVRKFGWGNYKVII